MISKVYDGQIIRFIDEENKKAYFKNLNLDTNSRSYQRVHNIMNQPEIRIDSVIEGYVDKINGVTVTYNPILECDFIYFEEVGTSVMNKLIEKIKSAFELGKESEILELTLNQILEK